MPKSDANSTSERSQEMRSDSIRVRAASCDRPRASGGVVPEIPPPESSAGLNSTASPRVESFEGSRNANPAGRMGPPSAPSPVGGLVGGKVVELSQSSQAAGKHRISSSGASAGPDCFASSEIRTSASSRPSASSSKDRRGSSTRKPSVSSVDRFAPSFLRPPSAAVLMPQPVSDEDVISLDGYQMDLDGSPKPSPPSRIVRPLSPKVSKGPKSSSRKRRGSHEDRRSRDKTRRRSKRDRKSHRRRRRSPSTYSSSSTSSSRSTSSSSSSSSPTPSSSSATSGPPPGSHGHEGSAPPAITLPDSLRALVEAIKEPPSQVIPMHPDLLPRWLQWVSSGIDADAFRELAQIYDPATHCPDLVPPAVDPILRRRVEKSPQVDRLDTSLQKSQTLTAQTLVAVSAAFNTLLAPDWQQNRDQLCSQLWDVTRMLCASHFRTTAMRRARLIKFFKPQFQTLARQQSVRSSFLFGDAAETWAKEATDVAKTEQLILATPSAQKAKRKPGAPPDSASSSRQRPSASSSAEVQPPGNFYRPPRRQPSSGHQGKTGSNSSVLSRTQKRRRNRQKNQ
ncbi:unnamed protein product, partial [Nesidiocoris tenuis]